MAPRINANAAQPARRAAVQRRVKFYRLNVPTQAVERRVSVSIHNAIVAETGATVQVAIQTTYLVTVTKMKSILLKIVY